MLVSSGMVSRHTQDVRDQEYVLSLTRSVWVILSCMVAGEEELRTNPRSRSAKLRVVEKL